ncbi:hypothetical protein MPTK1_1g06960 [Marchantia polymorpha subsp. ruderalis]|uniref:Uncharacterized protein n=2 Tax=Marchantia polymorpha TaxID=3197 RepID=A0AAF6AMD6_MARPO|nr:hypothetical protein MARPO_0043s0087 [Marchantia polymorpha]BBM97606.1 hypothetical protein Mp_1g06960 [Marchantia polymorpha subsp. ruderalis]|eukprot:PTQ39846.1 hypothetical protein MARPO_0043s0087 [Marchantia polymorpha]
MSHERASDCWSREGTKERKPMAKFEIQMDKCSMPLPSPCFSFVLSTSRPLEFVCVVVSFYDEFIIIFRKCAGTEGSKCCGKNEGARTVNAFAQLCWSDKWRASRILTWFVELIVLKRLLTPTRRCVRATQACGILQAF